MNDATTEYGKKYEIARNGPEEMISTLSIVGGLSFFEKVLLLLLQVIMIHCPAR